MSTTLFEHGNCRLHLVPLGHPERPERLEAIMRRLAEPEFASLRRIKAPIGARKDLLRVHPKTFIDAISNAVPNQGIVDLDQNTHMSPGSLNAALRAVGACTAAVDQVINGKTRNAFCAIRPPGHHAETARAMGFCLFGNLAVAAKRAIEVHDLDRLAIFDFDVHHGNGTIALLWDEPRTLVASTHQMPLFPGTGTREECGAHGQIVNLPLPPGTGSREFRRIVEQDILPRMHAHAPQLVLISAGFDAHIRDPLANLELEADDFAWVTEQMCDLADTHCSGRIVSTLEGGYDLQGLSDSVAAHVRVLLARGK